MVARAWCDAARAGAVGPRAARTAALWSLVAMLAWAHGAGTCSAQATGTLRLFITPDAGMRYVLDGKYRLSDRELTLAEGPHRFVFWAPERSMLDTVLHVRAGAHQEFHAHLFHSMEAIAHREAMHRHERGRRWGLALPPAITAGAAAWTVVSIVNWGRRHQELNDLRQAYRTTSVPDQLTSLKHDQVPAAKDAFNKARTMAYVSTGVLVLSAGATAWFRQRVARSRPPAFEDRERIRFEGLVFHADPLTGQGAWAAGLTVPIR
ncbi:MAG: hypothetical protein RBT71_12420 [Flavobacteriales bacterium]|nr:hypothetical protein [Flavobacteriales bacterium]